MLVEQCVVAVVFRLRQVARRLRGTHRCLGTGDLQLQVERIEFGQRLSGFDVVADIDQARTNLAGDAEAELAFVTRMHVAGVDFRMCRIGPLRMRDQREAGRLGRRRVGIAAGQVECRGHKQRGGGELRDVNGS